MSIVYAHEINLENKIINKNDTDTYKKCNKELISWRDNIYTPMRKTLEKVDLTTATDTQIESVVNTINNYIKELHIFCKKNEINAQSKLESTFLEEFMCYFLSQLKPLKNNELSIYNKGIFAGMKITPNHKIAIIPKDVDICIGKSESIKLNNEKEETELIIPLISVEVKTYMDATMLGEALYTARKIKGANPGSKAYIWAGLKDFKDDRLLEARYDSSIDEIITMGPKYKGYKRGNTPTLTTKGLIDFWNVLNSALIELSTQDCFPTEGRMLAYNIKSKSSLDAKEE